MSVGWADVATKGDIERLQRELRCHEESEQLSHRALEYKILADLRYEQLARSRTLLLNITGGLAAITWIAAVLALIL